MLHDRSIICFGGEDWWYHHPHSKYHLMRRFAKAGNRVIFVNSISMGLPSLSNKDLLPRIIRKLRSLQIGRLARRGGLANPILWIAIPTAVDMIGQFAERLVIYQVSDKY